MDNENGNGYDPAHRHRHNRGSEDGNPSEDLDAENGNATDALQRDATTEIILPIPFTSTSCATCLRHRKGDYILLNINAATQHARSHHGGIEVKYSCSKCGKTYKSKHATQCHVPKCTGPPTREANNAICGICKQGFKTQRGLSQHERLVHPAARNEKREQAATSRGSHKTNKGYGKVWRKDEVDTMLRLEKTLQGHPHIAKQMMEHLPGKTAKQIRDKRKEPSYKALTEQYYSETEKPRESTRTSSDSEEEIRPVTRKRYALETEDEYSTDLEQEPRQPDHSPAATGQTSLAHEQPIEEQLPHLMRPACEGPNTSNAETTEQRPASPQSPIRVGGTPGNEDGAEQQWQTDILRQTLAATSEDLPVSSKCKDLHLRLVSLLKEIGDEQQPVTQALIDDIYAQVLAQIETTQTKRTAKFTKRQGPKTQAGRKRKRKRYEYARTQDLFRKDPKLLAKYIREGTPWLEEKDPSSPTPKDVKSFYSTLWGAAPNITIPFAVTGLGRIARDIGEVFQAITTRDINERLKYTRQNTASGPDGIQRKHLTGSDTKEILRILYNIILVSKIQPRAWNTNRTILIPKQGKDGSRVENYRPLTIGSLICRTYWGIIDKKLREVTSFSPRQKGFVREAGCFNNVHILNEIIRAAKKKKGLVAIQLDIAKAFDTVPHKAVEAALKRLGLPMGVRESIMNSYKDLTTAIEYAGSKIEVPLLRGVKQRDPLSPFIFNAIIDPLLEDLEQMKGYMIDESHYLSALAFADDLILLASSKEKALSLLHRTESFLTNLGMRIAAEKCASFEIKTTKDSWYIASPDLSLTNGDKIPSSAADSTLCYLGGHISPWSGLQYEALVAKLETTLERCRSAQLKPHQKLSLTATYLVPHFLYQTTLVTPPVKTLRALDQTIRNHVKVVLHLPMSTPNGLLYCSKRDGGLGIPKMETLAACSALKQGITLLNSLDPTTRALLQETKLEQRLENLAKTMRLPWPILNVRAIDSYKMRMKKDELKAWSLLPTKGRGVTAFADDRNGNAWLYNPYLLKPSRFLTALRLRGGMTSDKVTMNKVVPQTFVRCRDAESSVEDLGTGRGVVLGRAVATLRSRLEDSSCRRDETSSHFFCFRAVRGSGMKANFFKVPPCVVVVPRLPHPRLQPHHSLSSSFIY